MADTNKTILEQSTTAFSTMIKEFGAVTVMNAAVYNANGYDFTAKDAAGVLADFEKVTTFGTTAEKGTPIKLAFIDSLKIANLTMDGPSKTVTGGQYSNPLIKFGKTMRLEMQDALGRADVLEAFGGAVLETNGTDSNIKVVHVTEDFTGPKTIVGETFFIDRNSGRQVPVRILIYQILPDSIFNLSQDAEGDATVFDMNADVLTTVIKTYDNTGADIKHGVFYSILEPTPKTAS